MQEFEWYGEWWLPEKPKDKVRGTLKFYPTEATRLETKSAFNLGNWDGLFQPKIILGLNSQNEKLTLYKCSGYYLPHASDNLFIANYVFKGHHFQKEDDIAFDSLRVYYSHLNEWFGYIGFKRAKISQTAQGRGEKFRIDYSRPEKIDVEVNNVKISIDSDFKAHIEPESCCNLNQIFFIDIEPKVRTHIITYEQDICHYVQNFLSLGMGIATYPHIVKGQRKIGGKKEYQDIFIYRAQTNQPDLSKKLFPNDMLFSYSDISDCFGQYLSNWFYKRRKLKPVYNLYFSMFYSPFMYVEQRFLLLIQALESYHRIKFEKKRCLY